MTKLSDTAIKVASKSACRYKVSAIALDKRGNVLATASNSPRFAKLCGGVHAELAVLRKAKVEAVRTVLIARVNKRGDLLPIDPCPTCSRVMGRLGIKIRTIR
jgi:cytidine deaminase